jgi:C1A family cysteine protease
LDHALLVVGYNTTADIPYWIVKNSYGTGWGVAGYLYVTIGEVRNGCETLPHFIHMCDRGLLNTDVSTRSLVPTVLFFSEM